MDGQALPAHTRTHEPHAMPPTKPTASSRTATVRRMRSGVKYRPIRFLQPRGFAVSVIRFASYPGPAGWASWAGSSRASDAKLIPMMRALVVIAVTIAPTGRLEAQTADSSGALHGVYSDSQAMRGASVFRRVCSACHVTTQFSGATFRGAWSGRNAFELFELIRTTMPQDNPGRLRRQEYADVVAYVFRLNGMPPGTRDLPTDSDSLRAISFGARP